MPNPVNWEKEERRRKRRMEFIRHWNENEKISLMVRLKLAADMKNVSKTLVEELLHEYSTGSHEWCWTRRSRLETHVSLLETWQYKQDK